LRRETVISRNRKTAPAAETLLDVVAKSLDDDKAEDVVVIDLEGKSRTRNTWRPPRAGANAIGCWSTPAT
jgi:hypothetical protein